MTASKRSLEFAWLSLVGLPGKIWCGVTHCCMCGHLHHEDVPDWRFYADFIWIAALLAAAISVLQSDLPYRFIPFGLLILLIFADTFLALPLLIYLAFVAIQTIRRVRDARAP